MINFPKPSNQRASELKTELTNFRKLKKNLKLRQKEDISLLLSPKTCENLSYLKLSTESLSDKENKVFNITKPINDRYSDEKNHLLIQYKEEIDNLQLENKQIKTELDLYKQLSLNQEKENRVLKGQIRRLESEMNLLQMEKSLILSPKRASKISSPKLSRIMTVDSLLLKD